MRQPAPVAVTAGTTLAALIASVMLTACGGASEATGSLGQMAEADADRARISATLLDDEGNPMPSDPALTPADAGARTRTSRYASAAQADDLERAMGSHVISVAVEPGPDGHGAVLQAVQMAYALQAAYGLGRGAPVLVRGTDLRLAAGVADRLGEAGFDPVFVVTR